MSALTFSVLNVVACDSRDDDDCEAVMKIKTPMNIYWKEEQKHDKDIPTHDYGLN